MPKHVTITVDFVIEVPNDICVDEITTQIGSETSMLSFNLGASHVVDGNQVISYETTSVTGCSEKKA